MSRCGFQRPALPLSYSSRICGSVTFISSGKRRSTSSRRGGGADSVAWSVTRVISDGTELGVAERRQVDAERLHLIANPLDRADENRLLELLDRRTEPSLIGDAVGLDLGQRGRGLRCPPR